MIFLNWLTVMKKETKGQRVIKVKIVYENILQNIRLIRSTCFLQSCIVSSSPNMEFLDRESLGKGHRLLL